MSQKDNFLLLVENLQKKGYSVQVTQEDGYRFAKVTGKSIVGGFCDVLERIPYLNSRISFNNAYCFDKWSKCPYSYPIPQNESQLSYVVAKMEYLATKEGASCSNYYKIRHEIDYPKNIS